MRLSIPMLNIKRMGSIVILLERSQLIRSPNRILSSFLQLEWESPLSNSINISTIRKLS